MREIRLKASTYSDAAYVEGVYRRDPNMERALYGHCKQYFDVHYQGVFFVGGNQKEEIFQEAFIKLWENIEKRKIYVEDDVLRGKEGLPLTGRLTTYFMGIARLKYLEWVGKNRNVRLYDDDENVWDTADPDTYKELLYDEGENAMETIVSDCISHMSRQCSQILTMFYYEEKTLDDMMGELTTFESKNALKTRKYKCMEELRKSANQIYDRYLRI